VIDDEPAVVSVLTRILSHGRDLDPLGFSSGLEALQWLEANTPSLVIIDLHMPELDGFEVVHRLRAHPHTRATPILMLTGQDEPESWPQACAGRSGAVGLQTTHDFEAARSGRGAAAPVIAAPLTLRHGRP
jgi:CheY-like chemotaxis protein